MQLNILRYTQELSSHCFSQPAIDSNSFLADFTFHVIHLSMMYSSCWH